MSTRTLQQGQQNPLIFSTIPSMSTPIFRQKVISRCTVSRDSYDGLRGTDGEARTAPQKATKKALTNPFVQAAQAAVPAQTTLTSFSTPVVGLSQ